MSGWVSGIFPSWPWGKKPVVLPQQPPQVVLPPPTFAQALVAEAQKWIGIHEKGGNNQGPDVERFQRAVDGKASGEPWCMSFVQFCVKEVEAQLKITVDLTRTEHCLTCWNEARNHRTKTPQVGSIAIWQHGGTTSGHCGIVTKVVDTETFETVEGNTSPSSGVDGEGDGVYKKIRKISGAGKMRMIGFITLS